jgi:hypothetical protein
MQARLRRPRARPSEAPEYAVAVNGAREIDEVEVGERQVVLDCLNCRG